MSTPCVASRWTANSAMLRGLGSCQLELSEFEAALSNLREARILAEDVGDLTGAALARKDAGFTLSLIGRCDEAEKELHTAAIELEQLDQHHTRAMALSNLAFAQRQQGRTAEAVRTARSAQAVARSCADPFIVAYASRGLAGALLAAGQSKDAEEAARSAAELFERFGDPIGAAQSLRTLGEAVARQPLRQAEAARVLGAAAALFGKWGHDWGLALTELSLGEMQVRTGAPGATDRLQRALRFWTAEQVPALRGRTLVAMADAAERAGITGARELLTQAYQLYLELGMPDAATLAARLGLPGA